MFASFKEFKRNSKTPPNKVITYCKDCINSHICKRYKCFRNGMGGIQRDENQYCAVEIGTIPKAWDEIW